MSPSTSCNGPPAATPGGSCFWSATRRRTWITRRTPNIRSRCRVAKQKDIIVNTVLAGNAQDTERVWRDIAQNGNGRFIPIPQDGGQIVVIETPFDQDIIILQREINGTVIPYGPRALQKRTEDKTRQLSQVAAAAPSQASEMASYLNKRARVSSEAVTGDGDLVSDVAAGRQKLSAVKDEELPENLRALKPEARMDEVNKQMNQ